MGISRNMIILGKHSGRHAIKHRLAEYGIPVADDQMEHVYNKFKETADAKKIVTDNELIRIAGELTNTQPDPYVLQDLHVHAGTQRSRTATVTIRENEHGTEQSFVAIGEGPLEAVIRAIQQAIPVAAEFEDLELHSLSTGEDAHGEAVVSIIHNNKRFRGTSIHNDIVLAAAQAYVAACNQAVMTTSRPVPVEGAAH
jgi:2-isopropylmalate synthase